MKRFLGLVIILGFVGVLSVNAQQVKTGKAEVIDLGKGIKLEMVLVPAGKFVMGSPGSEKGRDDDETQHEVTLTKPFYMGKYEVTQEQWQVIMGNNPSKKTKGDKMPVTDVSWNDSQEFIKKLEEKTKKKCRLPTEAEWEYACRAGTTTAYSFGNKITENDANINGSSVKKVGIYKPNTFGLYDMHGNVREWCNDRFGQYPKEKLIDPQGALKGDGRLLRNGAFREGPESSRSAARNDFFNPDTRSYGSGFRLAMTK